SNTDTNTNSNSDTNSDTNSNSNPDANSNPEPGAHGYRCQSDFWIHGGWDVDHDHRQWVSREFNRVHWRELRIERFGRQQHDDYGTNTRACGGNCQPHRDKH